jgi:gamma-glutamylputrescine oxidase
MPESPRHADSYYAATRNDRSDYPRLEGSHEADAVVVGGGFTGVSAALSLAERGYSVVLLEAQRIGWGASGRNGGQLIDGFVETARIARKAGTGAAGMARRMALECRDLVVARIRRYDIDCDFRPGFVYLGSRRTELRGIDAEFADREQAGYPFELRRLDGEKLGAYVGSSRYAGGLFIGGNGHLHPLNLCAGEARAAAALGARIFEGSPVSRIRHGVRPVVETATGSVRAARVVLAGNAYLAGTEPRLDGKVVPAGSYIAATEPLSGMLSSKLLPADAACCEYRVVPDYFRLSADRRMLFGGLCTYSGREPRDIDAAIRPRMLRVFPELGSVRIEYRWGGHIAISLNRIPQFGRIDGNTYYAQGYSGHGVAPAHLAGKLLADAIAGDSEAFDVFARIKHLRLPGGRRFANPVLALGMLFYRLSELL